MACFYQVFGQKNNTKVEGWGDCQKCIKDKKNKECEGYFHINTTYFDTEDEKNDA